MTKGVSVKLSGEHYHNNIVRPEYVLYILVIRPSGWISGYHILQGRYQLAAF